jgi:hypothetical protein
MGTDLQVESAVLGRLVLCPEQRMRNLHIIIIAWSRPSASNNAQKQ